MTLIDGDKIVTAQLYDDEYEEFKEEQMSIIDYVNIYTTEGITEADIIRQTGWIPCSERLPEDRRAVLVWCPQYQNIYCAYLEKEQWWIFGAFVQIVPNEVVAWMPLPAPYELQKESEG